MDEGHTIVESVDQWWTGGVAVPAFAGPVIFHGSLGNAALVEKRGDIRPGAYCPVPAFHCTAWYPHAERCLLHKRWRATTAAELVANPSEIAKSIACEDRIFVRPDSPLKPFSGRVLNVDQISLRSLDHGFYYEDENLPIIVAPVVDVVKEWRFVIVDQVVVAGCRYDADSRFGTIEKVDPMVRQFAEETADLLPPPSSVYVLDVCESDGQHHLIELNPFGGADLYTCDADAIVRAISQFASKEDQQ